MLAEDGRCLFLCFLAGGLKIFTKHTLRRIKNETWVIINAEIIKDEKYWKTTKCRIIREGNMEIVTGKTGTKSEKYEIRKKDILFDGVDYAIFQKSFDDKMIFTIKIDRMDVANLKLSHR
jgi:hypothetical protein